MEEDINVEKLQFEVSKCQKNHTVGQVIEGEVTLWACFPEIILILIVQREFDLFSVADNSKSHSCLLLKNLV